VTCFFEHGKAQETHIFKIVWRYFGWYAYIEDSENGDWYLPFGSELLNFENVRKLGNIHDKEVE
jgi:hypothetical protein